MTNIESRKDFIQISKQIAEELCEMMSDVGDFGDAIDNPKARAAQELKIKREEAKLKASSLRCNCDIVGMKCEVFEHRCSCQVGKVCLSKEHICVCWADPNKCKLATHDCICNVGRYTCMSSIHVCVCGLSKIACLASTHTCVCMTSREPCAAAEHNCLCVRSIEPLLHGDRSKRPCLAKKHQCVCIGKKRHPACQVHKATATRAHCICNVARVCDAIVHDCICASRPYGRENERCRAREHKKFPAPSWRKG